MKSILKATLACAAAAFSLTAQAVGHLADVAVIDRDSGNVLETHYFKGEYWVAGTPGARYAIAIRNRLGERILAVTAVDGVNVLSGDTAAWSQTGYVFWPKGSYEISGWRKSDSEVAAFLFTAAPNAYATRTGRPRNLGIIGVALFRERTPEPSPLFRGLADSEDIASAGAPSAAAGQAGTLGGTARNSVPVNKPEQLGTGHGARERSVVEQTDFERLSDQPDELIRIRYDSLANLIAMGVIRRSQPGWAEPDPFPDSPLARYVPDPPGYR
jgi:hypothetical protein